MNGVKNTFAYCMAVVVVAGVFFGSMAHAATPDFTNPAGSSAVYQGTMSSHGGEYNN